MTEKLKGVCGVVDCTRFMSNRGYSRDVRQIETPASHTVTYNEREKHSYTDIDSIFEQNKLDFVSRPILSWSNALSVCLSGTTVF